MIKPYANPLLSNREEQQVFKIEGLDPTSIVYRDKENLSALEPKLLLRKQSAKEFLGPLRQGIHLYGFSKGQFSLIDLIEAIVEQLGKVDISMSTWTAANADLQRLDKLLRDGVFGRVRFLFDFSFQRRQPGVIQTIREIYGMGAVRCAKNHAKFLLIQAGDYRIVVRTSMNLNFNPRFEDIDVKDDPKIYAFLEGILNRIFEEIPAARQIGQSVRDHNLDFARFKG